ncbi:uncharacterized protein LOC119274695 [Triticum dicoccoides]|uniref:uncharacterized protein LOC119274695 n=1 Tax=Triticum dicoccoides TaxID=85692 RepID=UPI000E7867DA|nr:uncharacterized protein LOC119274695 [Triticum dicoccoides]
MDARANQKEGTHGHAAVSAPQWRWRPRETTHLSSCQIQLTESLVADEANQTLLCAAAESSIGDAAVTVQVDLNSTCDRIALPRQPQSSLQVKTTLKPLAGQKESDSGMDPMTAPHVLPGCVPWNIENICRKEN